MLLDALHFIGWALSELARLIDDGRRQQLRRIEVADSEPLEPCLMSASDAVKLRALDVPQLDIDAVRAALAEQERGHSVESIDLAKERQNLRVSRTRSRYSHHAGG